MCGFKDDFVAMRKSGICPWLGECQLDEETLLGRVPVILEAIDRQHYLILGACMPIGCAALVHVPQSSSQLWRVGERWIFNDADGRPAGFAPLVLQIQYDLEGVVEQQRLDLWGHSDTSHLLFSKTHGKEAGQWGHEAVLRVCET